MEDEFREYRIEQAGAWLDRIRRMGVKVRTLEGEIAELRADAEGLKALDYTRERVSMSPSGDRMAEIAALVFDKLDEFTDEYGGYMFERERARSCIMRLPDERHAAVLVRRYLSGQLWKEISESMGYDLRTVYRLRADGLCELYDLMPPTERDPIPSAM